MLPPGYTGLRICSEGSAEAATETLQSSDPSSGPAHPVSVAVPCSGENQLLHSNLDHTSQSKEAGQEDYQGELTCWLPRPRDSPAPATSRPWWRKPASCGGECRRALKFPFLWRLSPGMRGDGWIKQKLSDQWFSFLSRTSSIPSEVSYFMELIMSVLNLYFISPPSLSN